MQIDWLHYSPGTALLGGVLIGLASTFLLLVNGRIAGVSGIIGGLLQSRSIEHGWRLAFVIGVLISPIVWKSLISEWMSAPHLASESIGQLLPFVFGGVLVGIGTRLANGCTSGHGICGLARFSFRSLIAVLVFMGSAMVVVYLTHHVIGVGS